MLTQHILFALFWSEVEISWKSASHRSGEVNTEGALWLLKKGRAYEKSKDRDAAKSTSKHSWRGVSAI